MNYCVDLMALFIEVAASVSQGMCNEFVVNKGAHTREWHSVVYNWACVLALGCSDSDLSMNTCLDGVRTGTVLFYLKLKVI